MNATQASECPSQFALDDRALHGAGGPAGAQTIDSHVEGCARCQAALAARAADRASFDETAPVLWTRIAARRRARVRWRSAWLGVPALIAGLGAAVLMIAARGPGPAPSPLPYVGPKGRPPIAIACRRAGTVFGLAPGDEVAPGDELRFTPLPVRPDARFVHVGSVDGTGRYTPFYPLAGAAGVVLPAPGQPLDGGIRLDAAPGPERLFVVLSAAALSVDAVRAVAEANAGARTTVDRIDGVSVTTAWIVLPKRAGAPAP
ncbi:MAG TPA: hypothetical protein VN903_01370 [Polyangia bacterium]|nr:hypothetical protein [Polyangia bacterium]